MEEGLEKRLARRPLLGPQARRTSVPALQGRPSSTTRTATPLTTRTAHSARPCHQIRSLTPHYEAPLAGACTRPTGHEAPASPKTSDEFLLSVQLLQSLPAPNISRRMHVHTASSYLFTHQHRATSSPSTPWAASPPSPPLLHPLSLIRPQIRRQLCVMFLPLHFCISSCQYCSSAMASRRVASMAALFPYPGRWPDVCLFGWAGEWDGVYIGRCLHC